jgi:hypothetical protein
MDSLRQEWSKPANSSPLDQRFVPGSSKQVQDFNNVLRDKLKYCSPIPEIQGLPHSLLCFYWIGYRKNLESEIPEVKEQKSQIEKQKMDIKDEPESSVA